MTLLMHILRTDNEENAVLSLKIMIDLHRNYKSVVIEQVQPFLDFVYEMYQNMPAIVKDAFDTNATMTGNTPAATVISPCTVPRLICSLRSLQSQDPWPMNSKAERARLKH